MRRLGFRVLIGLRSAGLKSGALIRSLPRICVDIHIYLYISIYIYK